MRRFAAGSVRTRVTGLATLIVAALLITVATALVIAQQLTLTAALDTSLSRRADALEAQFDLSGVPASLPGSGDNDAAQLVSRTGEVVAFSTNLADAAALRSAPPDGEVVASMRIEAIEDETFRVLSRPVSISGVDYVLHVAAAGDDVADSVRVLAISLAVVVPLAIGGLGALVWWLVGRALRPVEAIRSEVAAIGAGELHRRVPVPDDDDEIAALAGTMNDMLMRLEDAAARQQAFVADASHELRSPLTRIRSELEVDLAADEAGPDDARRSVLDEVDAMERLVDDLLYLARSDAGEQTTVSQAVDLDDLVFDELERIRPNSRVTIDASRVSAAQVHGDPRQLARAIRNLVDNAVRHAAAAVHLELGEEGDVARLAVSDDGPGVPAPFAARIFDRFTRVEESRSRGTGGTGLGLAITADIAERHGGTVALDTTFQRGARFVLTLPRQSTEP